MKKVFRPLTTAASLALLLPSALPAAAVAAGAARTGADTQHTAARACSPGNAIEHTLRGGGTWRMCWHDTRLEGLVLEDITFQPKGQAEPIKILHRAALAQIHVPYDNGTAEYSDLTADELGAHANPLRPKDCPGGALRQIRSNLATQGETVSGLCVTTQERGFAYHGDSDDLPRSAHRGNEAQQGQDLVVYTVNEAGHYHYINQWNFSDDGTITPKLGSAGNLSPGDFNAADGTGWPLGEGSKAYSTSHYHNVFWRLVFDPDSTPTSRVEQYETRQTGYSKKEPRTPLHETTRKSVQQEMGGLTDAHTQRWWRIVSKHKNTDGHPRSWEIVHHNPHRYTGRPFTEKDIYFTEYKAGERYASDNKMSPELSRLDHVGQFVDGEKLTRPVTWVQVGYHHIPRDEDQAPMPVHWQSFQITPRDVTAMNPLTPHHLHQHRYNGDGRHTAHHPPSDKGNK
ncbi:copper amine oxidase [Streptomyces purpurogeneiscleroticus]|uniref:copper amine oxidase n=1 Tax=Streptomyces purpurogeneiscleroticus TaxID=68259 RepID=UPI001CBFB678|nr:copper amine oxidase [Streptomyces purpurogeneiscleroticus]MBZ4014346.1 copper amine oxidase [Streptomyces purpurogeneiscleroticus]